MKNLLAVLSLAILFGAPSIAQAQTPRPAATPKATPTPAPAPVATPAPIVAEPEAAPQPEAPAAPVARFEPGMGEPNDKTFGIGAGWFFPADIFTPNTVSARFRLKSGLTVEPFVNASFAQSFEHTHLVVGDNRPHVASRDYVADLGLGVQLRKPMSRRGPIQMTMLMTPSVGVTDSVDNPVGADDRVFTTSTLWALGWGLGVEYYPPKFEQHWSVSMDALNPLFAFSYATTYDQATNIRTNTTAYALSATFDPTVRGMVHLYY